MRRSIFFFLALLFSHLSFGQSITPAGPVKICSGKSQILTVSGTASAYRWQKNGTDISGATNQFYIVNDAGDYRVIINDGKTKGDTLGPVKVIVNPLPKAGFTSSTQNLCGNLPIHFTNTSTGAASYTWDFGDPTSGVENTSAAKDPSHVFWATGNTTRDFTVKLVATTAEGCKDSISQKITVKEIPDGNMGGNDKGSFAGKEYFKVCGNAPSGEFTFSNYSSTRSTNTNYRIIWGDGSPDFTGSDYTLLTHTYSIGPHNLKIIISGQNGCTDTTEYGVFVGTNPAVGLGNPGNTAICSGSSLSFPISSTESNPPGTVYTVTFNDGSAPITYIHPTVPSSITHLFDITSCGTPSSSGSNTYYNSFRASIVASNPCNSSEATVVPIYVSQKPKADFTINPKDTVCINRSVRLQNISLTQKINNGQCDTSNAVWTITPSTGWTLASGQQLGDDNGSNLPDVWLPGSGALDILFTQTGVYTIKIKTGNNFCGISEKVKTICVNPTPTVSYTLDKTTGCGPLTVSTKTTASNPTCGKNIFKWNVQYAPEQGCGNTKGNFSYGPGTNASSEEPVFIFNDPGTYTVSLNMISPGGTCSTYAPAKVIILKAKPQASVSGIPADICQGLSIQLKVNASCFLDAGTTFNWSFANGSPSTSTSQNPGTIIFNTPGKQNISVSVTNECGITQIDSFVQVNPTPDISAPSDIAVCAGEVVGATNFTATPAGASFTWTNSNPAIGLVGSGNSGNVPAFTATNGGSVALNAIITARATIGKCSDNASFNIKVNPLPSGPVVQNASYCKDATPKTLTATASAGNSLIWYTTATGGTGSAIAPSPSTSTVGTTTYYVSQKSSTTNCEGPRVPLTVIVNEIPNITNVTTTNPTSCGSTTGLIALHGLKPNTTYSLSYNKNSIPVLTTAISDASGSITISGLTAGSYTNISVTLSGCPSNKVGPLELFDPNPPTTPSPTSNSEICSGNKLTLFANIAEAGLDYIWTGPNGFSSTDKDPVIGVAATSASGTYNLIIRKNNCSSAPGATVVKVNATPVINAINSNTPLCSGSTLQLTSSINFQGAVMYTWTGPDGFIDSVQNPIISDVTTAASGTYTLSVTSKQGNCKSQPGNVSIVVNLTPQISKGDKNDPVNCATPTGFITLYGLTPSTKFDVYYKQDGVSKSISATSDGTGKIIIPGLPAGTYDQIFVSFQNCQSNQVGPFTLVDPNPPAAPTAASNSPLCYGNTLNLTASTSVTGTVNYKWVGPDGFTSADQNPVIPGATQLALGSYFVTITQNNCTSPASKVDVVINPLPSAPGTAPVEYCIDAPAIPLTATGTNLKWYSAPSGGSGNTLAPTPATSASGIIDYYVSQTNANGCESERSVLSVTVHPNAVAKFNPSISIDCPPFNITPAIISLTQYPTHNSQYSWYIDNVFAGNGTTFPGYMIVAANDSIEVKLVTTSLYGCKADSLKHLFKTYKLPNPSFTLDRNDGCGPLSVLISNTTEDIDQYNYEWDFGNGQISHAVQPGTINFPPNPTYTDTVYNIKLKMLSVCDTIILTKSVHVFSKPKALFTPDITSGCSPMKVLFKNTSMGIGNTYYWDFGDGQTKTTSTLEPVEHIFYTSKVDTFYVRLIASNSCGNDTLKYAIITAPNTIKLNFAMNGPDHFGCIPHTVAFVNNTSGASSFQWNFGDGNTLSTSKNIDTVYHTYYAAGEFTISLRAENNCSDTSTFDKITVYAKPTASFTSSANRSCKGEKVNFTNNSNLGTSYLWSFGDGVTSVLENPGHIYTVPGLYTVTLTVYKSNPGGSVCIDSSKQQIEVVSMLPGSMKLSSYSSECAPFEVTFVNQNKPSVTAVWDFGDGQTASGDSVKHLYQFSGTYTVSLVVTVAGGCTYTSSEMITIKGPSGTLNYTGGNYCYPDQVRFEAVSINTNTYHWNFGDGDTLVSNQPVVYHQYKNAGTYIPTVTLRNDAGCSYYIKGADSIKIDRVEAGFTIAQEKKCGTTIVTFFDTSYAFSGKQNISWDFGDGSFATGSTPKHTYTSTGYYQVKMIVQSKNGCMDTAFQNIYFHVNSKPVVSIQADREGCARLSIPFKAVIQSIDSLNILEWQISNGAKGTGTDFNYIFNQAGSYQLRFVAGTKNGCYDTSYHSIIIKPSPVVKASADITLCLGNSAKLSATGALTFQWSPFEGLSCADCPNPTVLPDISTPYIVAGYNNLGCPGYDTVNVTVIQPMQLTTSGNDSICIGQSANLMVSGGASYIWSPSTALSNSQISNPIATPDHTTTYRVIGYDGHNCFTDTAFLVVAVGQKATVKLGPDQTLATGTMFPLESEITNGPVKYWKWTPGVDLDCNDCPRPIAHIKNDITYSVDITTTYGCKASDSISIKVFCKSAQVFIPNAFSPDGDGVNDILMVRATGIVMVKSFRIFNRWGEIVFEKNNFRPNEPASGWDGKIRGKTGPPDVYVYTAEVLCENGVSYVYRGNTTILK